MTQFENGSSIDTMHIVAFICNEESKLFHTGGLGKQKDFQMHYFSFAGTS